MNTYQISLLAGGCMTAIFQALSAPAMAQEIPEEGAMVIDTVVVTAQRREQSMQQVPVTITAFTGDEIEKKGLDNIEALIDSTPGISMDVFPKSAPRPFIRGIGSSNQSAGADPSSVAFVDGVYYGRGPMLSIDAFDLERIEVLKGPQGTLWGKNVVGGAIQYITRKPDDEFLLKVRATLAEYDQKDFNVVLNTPVSDQLATRLSLSSKKNAGFRRNLNNGGPLDDDERLSGRFHALFDFDDSTNLLFTIDGTTDNTAGTARFNLQPTGNKDPSDTRVADPDRPGYIKRDTWGSKLELNSSALGWADLVGYISYRDLDNRTFEDLDGTTAAGNAAAGVPVPAIHILMEERAESFSAEMRLASATSGPFSWIAGAFALKDEVDRERESETAVVDTSENRFVAHNTTDSFAIFGDARYDISDAWGVFGGLRFTDETKTYRVRQLVGNPSSPTEAYSTYNNPGAADQQKWTWRLGTDYKVSDDVFLFASAATGFKSGAFQEQPRFETARIATAPEEVINYEVGIKTDFWNRRARANASIFFADYTNFQTIKTVPDAVQGPGLSRVVTDTADAEIKGLETQFQFLVSDNLRVNALYSYLDATFTSYVETQAFLADGSAVALDLSGNRLSRTPEHAATLSATYTVDPFSWGELEFGADAKYQSRIYDDNNNLGPNIRDPQTLLDVYVSLRPTDSLSLQLWARNITDEDSRLHQVSTAGGHFVQYGAPRQVGLTATLEF